ncbi:MAG: hypothetical protein LUD15_10280 [Bacteroides sp.]|nr:hypothetical protein [Bacteroides sp.]
MEAPNYSRAAHGENTSWITIPDLGKTVGAVTTTPVTVKPDQNSYLEYDIEFTSTGEAKIEILLSPTLNFNGNRGLESAVSLGGEPEQIVNFNGHYRGELGRWQAESIIKSVTTHSVITPVQQPLRFRALDPRILVQKIMIDMGGLKPSYLEAPESEKIK